jgi:predicted dehydrogenase
MEKGFHVLCEKPIAVSEQDALAMIAAAKRTGVKFGIAFCKRFSNLIRKLREIIAGGQVGRPVMYRFSTGWEIRFKHWIMDKRLGGGPLIDFACHFFDQWRFIFGSDPVRVKAAGMTFSVGAPELPGVEPELDTATVLVEYESGDIGVMSVSWGLPRGTKSANLEEVLAPGGVITVHGFEKLVVARTGREEVIEGLGNDMYLDQVKAFAQAVMEDKPVASTGEDGLLALRVSLAAIESARTGRAVELDWGEL